MAMFIVKTKVALYSLFTGANIVSAINVGCYLRDIYHQYFLSNALGASPVSISSLPCNTIIKK